MSTDQNIVLSVKDLSKQFQGNWALKDVSFDLNRGEIVGVIGKNGAGKSTLLKILSQITTPTEGRVEYEGTLTSILEIGTGFHPELTGKENVFLGGSIMGMSRKEIREVYDDIVDFSGLEGKMDRPVKFYSSGMYLRLAFSVAFHSKIDILLLDEVIAVGDVDFRRKCYERIRNLKDSGVSIILVSHFMEPIVSFCDRCILIEDGELVVDGAPLQVVEQYLDESKETGQFENDGNVQYVFELKTLDLGFLSINGFEIDSSFRMNDSISIQLMCEKSENESSFEIVYTLTNMNDIRVFIDSHALREGYEPVDMKSGNYTIDCIIPGNFLNRGVYTLGMMICRNDELVKEIERVAIFKVQPPENERYERQTAAIVRPQLDWKIQHN